MSHDFAVVAADGTRLRAWSNRAVRPCDAEANAGTPVVISNGLGSTPAAWPAVITRDSGFRVVTWFHRGLSGSSRPEDEHAIRVADHATDLGDVLDAAGIERALVIGWSIGVNVAFEFARRNPDRVAGILGVAGVPGGSLKAMYRSVGVPRQLREPAGQASAHLLRVTGPWLSFAMEAMARSNTPASGPADEPVVRAPTRLAPLLAVLREFAQHDWDWYSRLVLAAGEDPPMDVSSTAFPVTLLAGRHDAIASSDDMVAVGRTIQGVRVSVLPAATHLLPLQYPELVLDELRRLLARRAER